MKTSGNPFQCLIDFYKKQKRLNSKNGTNSRKIKKFNTKFINLILDELPFSINTRNFGSGYFIFDIGPNAICWFFMDELPDWKFSVWINEDGTFDIFGEAMVQINKFKPSASSLSFNNIDNFTEEVYKVINNHSDWKEYNNDTYNQKIARDKADAYNKRVYTKITDVISRINEEDLKIALELKDDGENCSPRYQIHLLAKTQNYFDTEECAIKCKEAYLELSKCMDYHKDNYEDPQELSSFYLDDYIFDDTKVYNPEIYNDEAVCYNWEVKTFQEYVSKRF